MTGGGDSADLIADKTLDATESQGKPRHAGGETLPSGQGATSLWLMTNRRRENASATTRSGFAQEPTIGTTKSPQSRRFRRADEARLSSAATTLTAERGSTMFASRTCISRSDHIPVSGACQYVGRVENSLISATPAAAALMSRVISLQYGTSRTPREIQRLALSTS